jgi:hypothetical protein
MAPGRSTHWKCPKCGDRFLAVNRRHSCGKFKLEPLLAVCDPKVAAAFRKLVSVLRENGAIRVIPKKSMIIFQATRRFGAVTTGKARIRCSLMLPRLVSDHRFERIHTFGPGRHEHIFGLRTEADLDASVVEWIRDAYRLASDARPDIPPAIARRYR